MTHAAHSHDAIERLMQIRDHLDQVISEERQREAKLSEAVIMANAIALLRKISAQSRCSDSDRKAARALAAQLGEVA